MGYAAVSIPEKIFFKIGEVCDLVGVQAHVLRYWETEFPMLSPQKNRSGQRSYRRRDVEIALRIKELLYEDLYTIAGAKKKLQNEMRDSSRLKIVHSENTKKESFLKEVKRAEPVEDVELDDEIEFEDSEESVETEVTELDEDRREALVSLTEQLLELRELLRKKNV
ncbi:MAG: MerR family transcriptional regulator [Pyrinomonadaceae bacterium]|nr:MerR family transcriptional regulator [Pyrinomonadaceae bacterium]